MMAEVNFYFRKMSHALAMYKHLQVWKGGHVDTSRLKKCKVHKYNINPHYADFTIVASDALQTLNSNRRTTFHYVSKQKQKSVQNYILANWSGDKKSWTESCKRRKVIKHKIDNITMLILKINFVKNPLFFYISPPVLHCWIRDKR